ncbi:LysR family transcriptional regulator [Marinobacterium stanieri]|uniref:LysR family transcriptional regulator, regulator for metE and metH n=1 Tax=Marinobacterium stanieri TaxID=49186 RepID=A0A1N6SID5_9GAMM|nr:LysR family transcriptional regulator [Marinobacterium stanieri]SIQ40915.1 LysR family transcriptional regulator, regulator for metE and metH [Marinobacterium stanieri]
MSARISTRHLQMILSIASTGSVSEAANQIGLSQSALSHRIREAERLLNTEIFYRKNKRLIPTSAGKRLLQSAKVILGELERAEIDINKLSMGIKHVVRIGNEAYGNYQWLPRFLSGFLLEHPSMSVEIIPDVSLDPYTALRNGTIDLSIVSGILTHSGFRALPLLHDEMVVVMPQSHAMADREWLSPDEIAESPYITYHTNPGPGREYEQLFSRYQILPPSVIRAGVTEAVVEFVRAGAGISIMPTWAVRPYLQQGGLSTAKATQEGLFIDWNVLVRNDEPEDSPASLLAEAITSTDLD